MNRYYITFGSAHLGGFGLYYYVVIDAATELIARRAAHNMFSGRWAGIYTTPPRHGEAVMGYAIAFLGLVDEVIVHNRRHVPDRVAEASYGQEIS